MMPSRAVAQAPVQAVLGFQACFVFLGFGLDGVVKSVSPQAAPDQALAVVGVMVVTAGGPSL
ncbi:hypothetical protein D3C86_1785390 [compost metagenome]